MLKTGKDRVWEAAARKTRGSGGVDAVAIAPILRHPNKPPSTMIILQYRPPVEAYCVEFPAGLIDEGESPEQAAVRELKEETGYEGKVGEASPVLGCQPGSEFLILTFCMRFRCWIVVPLLCQIRAVRSKSYK